MSLVLDGILLAVLAVSLIVGVKRGLIRSAAHFAGALLAVLLAAALAAPIARWIFDALFRQSLVDRVAQTMNSVGVDSVAAGLQNVLASLPDFIVRMLEEAGVTMAALEGIVAHGAGQAAELVADTLAPVFVSLLKVGVMLVLFLLFMMIVRGLADMVATVARLPLIRQVDGLLGGVCGLLLALTVIWLALGAIQVFLPMLAEDAQADVEIALNHSVLAGLLARWNPLNGLF